MKNLLLIILLNITLLSVEEPQPILDSISQHAIRIGDGKLSREYVFIDPMCKHSKKYIKIIMEDETLQKENSYYIFLYRLEKYDSDELIQYIYQSKDVKSALSEVMVEEKEIDLFDLETSEKVLKLVDEIAMVGKKLKVDHRPQMFTFYNPMVP